MFEETISVFLNQTKRKFKFYKSVKNQLQFHYKSNYFYRFFLTFCIRFLFIIFIQRQECKDFCSFVYYKISFCDIDKEIMPKNWLVLIFFDFKTHFNAKLHFKKSSKGLNRTISARTELFQKRNINVVACIRNQIVRRF